MTPKAIKELIVKGIPRGIEFLLVGAPGGGKTSINRQAAMALGWNYWEINPGISDPTDVKGFPFKDGNVTKYIPDSHLMELVNADKPTLAVLDDLIQAPTAVQVALMPMLSARKIGVYKISDLVVFAGTTNEPGQLAGGQFILEPLKDRWTCIVKYEPTADDWIEWAGDHTGNAVMSSTVTPLNRAPDTIPTWMISALSPSSPAAYVTINSKQVHLLNSWTPNRDLTRTPTGRALQKLAILDNAGIDDIEAWEGAVGNCAAQLAAFKKAALANLPSFDEIALTPDTAKIPDEPWFRYGVAVMCGRSVDVATFDRVLRYLKRFGDGAYETMMVRIVLKRHQELVDAGAPASEKAKVAITYKKSFIEWAKNNRASFVDFSETQA